MASKAAVRKKSKFTPHYLLEDIPTKGDMGNTLIKTFSQVTVGVIGGGLLSALIGKPSFLLGLGTAGLGNYFGSSWAAPLGIGMMASSHIVSDSGSSAPVNGVEGFDFKEEVGKAKDRLMTLKDSFIHKTYMDKIFKGKAGDTKTKQTSQRKIGDGEENPENVNGLSDTPSDSVQELDKIEQQLITAAMEFQKKQQAEKEVKGVDPDLFGLEEEVDFSKL